MPQQTLTAFFDSRSDASKAADALVEAGISRSSLRLTPETESSSSRSTERSSYDATRDEGGFWASLGNLFLPDEDRYAYSEGLSRGGVMLSIVTDDAHAARVSEIVERYGAVDMDEREASWKREGWAGYAGTGATSAATTQTSSASAAQTASRGTTNRNAEAIPIVEEQLKVGKRVVEKGRVRIRSYMVETPVQEQVSLRQEHVQVERRPVDRPVTAADEALFRERTIEAEERGEEAVVSKEARVKEELVVKKDVEERTQTIQDKVRHTEVEVEDGRGGTTGRVAGTGTDRDRR